jgi:hypothetical protein
MTTKLLAIAITALFASAAAAQAQTSKPTAERTVTAKECAKLQKGQNKQGTKSRSRDRQAEKPAAIAK